MSIKHRGNKTALKKKASALLNCIVSVLQRVFIYVFIIEYF